MFKLIMVRGKRQVFIGYLVSDYRAQIVANALSWSSGWKTDITKVQLSEVGR